MQSGMRKTYIKYMCVHDFHVTILECVCVFV